jgi:hypothetical protein
MLRHILDLCVVAVVTGLCAFVPVALAQPAPQADMDRGNAGRGCVDAAVQALSASQLEGSGGICIDQGVLHAAFQVSGLTTGHTYTAWLAYFDRPALCAQSPCGMVDLRGDDPTGVLVRVGGGVARDDGELELRTSLADMQPGADSQVTLLLLNHGPSSEADGRSRARQLLTPQSPDLGSPLGGAAVDGARAWPHAQVVLHLR